LTLGADILSALSIRSTSDWSTRQPPRPGLDARQATFAKPDPHRLGIDLDLLGDLVHRQSGILISRRAWINHDKHLAAAQSGVSGDRAPAGTM